MTYAEGGHYIAMDLTGFVLLLLVGLFYFLPTLIAAMRKVAGLGGVFICNLLLGWTLIGWLVSLVMAAVMENTYERELRRATQRSILRMANQPEPNRQRL